MKNYLKTAGFVLAMIAFSPALNAQNRPVASTTIPSDAPSGYTYDFDKVMDLIVSRIETPKKENSEAKVFLAATDFPTVPTNKIVDASYKAQLKIWIEKNPTLIINTLKSRKDIVTQY